MNIGRTVNASRPTNISSNTNEVNNSGLATRAHNVSDNVLSFNLSDRDLYFGHTNIQGICGKDMTKFS